MRKSLLKRKIVKSWKQQQQHILDQVVNEKHQISNKITTKGNKKKFYCKLLQNRFPSVCIFPLLFHLNYQTFADKIKFINFQNLDLILKVELKLYLRISKGAKMGIDGLLKLLKPITERQHISSFKNQRVGIDMMPWIYRGCYSCNFELSQNIQSFRFLYYPLEMIEILSYYNIKPIFVFDGRTVSMKNQTNQKRKKQKQQNKQKGMKFLKEGNIQEARKYLSRCIFIDEKIISKTIDVLYSKNIEFIISPYEADCQLAKLKKLGLIDVAISEDSDLLVYGVNTILKLNQNGDCDYVDVNKWKPRDVDSQFLKQYLSMDKVNRIEAAVLAGSDYNSSIKGIGIKRAVRNLYRQANMKNVIEKLKNQKVYADKIPQNYSEQTQKVKMIFLFATSYNPIEKTLEYLSPQLIDQNKPEQMSLQELNKIVGEFYPQYCQRQVCTGKTQAKSLKPRQVKTVNIRELFTVNKQNMILHQSFNNRRRQQQKMLLQDRSEQMQKGAIYDDTEKYDEKNKNTKNKTQKSTELTQQQKEQRKAERKNRIIKLQEVMNSVVEMCEEQERMEVRQESENEKHSEDLRRNEDKIITNHLKLSEIKMGYNYNNSSFKANNDNSDNSEEQMEDESSQSQPFMEKQSESFEFDLGHLNPFAKKNIQTSTAIKQKKRITK